MKLHLPSMLRKALLACFAAVTSLSTTVATGVVTGGVVAWAIAAQQAQAGWGSGYNQNGANYTDGYVYYMNDLSDINTTQDVTDAALSGEDKLYIQAGDLAQGTVALLTVKNNDTIVFSPNAWGGSAHANLTGLTITSLSVADSGSATVEVKESQIVTLGSVTGSLSALTVGGEMTLNNSVTVNTRTTVQSSGELVLNFGGINGALNTPVDVYGKLTLNTGDATGWGNAVGIREINIFEGGEMYVAVQGQGKNQTGCGLTINLEGGNMSGIAGSNMDLGYAGGDLGYSTINALAEDGATSASPTESTISGVNISMRQRLTTLNVEENARLVISSALNDKTDYLRNEPGDPARLLTKSGAGELVLAGQNGTTTAILVQAGTLTLSNGGVLNSAVTVNEGATFKLHNGGVLNSAVTVNEGATFKLQADTAAVSYGKAISGAGKVVKTGTNIATLSAENLNLTALDVQAGFVAATHGLTVNTLSVAESAGFAYEMSAMTEETAAAITASSYSGALSIKLLGGKVGTYQLANVSGAMSLDDVDFVGVSNRLSVTPTISAEGLLSVAITNTTEAMDLTWDVEGASNVWASSGDTNWDSADDDTAADTEFINGDSVTFAGTGETISISGSVAPNNMSVTGTGYVFEGGSLAATGKLTVATSADAHIKSQASFAGGVEVAGTLTITDDYTGVNNRSALGAISGAGNVVLNLQENNGIGFDFSGMTGGTINLNAGRLQLDNCLFNTAADATLPTIKLTNSGDLVFNDDVDVRNNVVIEGDIAPDVYVNSSASDAKMYGSITGGDNAILRVQPSGTWTVYGDMNVGTLSLWGATTKLASTVKVRDLSVAGGTITLEDDADVTAETLRLSNERACSSRMTINAGATMRVTGTAYADSNTDSLMIAHWSGNSTLQLNGGDFDATGAVMQLSWAGKGTFEAISGTASVKGITFNAQSGDKGVLKLGTADGTAALTVNIGSHGITNVQGNDVTFELGNGTLAASDHWSMTGSGTVNLVGTTGTTIDTGAYTVKIAPTLSGTGKLIKTGSGTLEIGAATTTLADLSIRQGFVQAGGALALSALAVTDGAGFAYDLVAGANKVTASNYSGALTLSLVGLAETEGTELFQGASSGLSKEDIKLDYHDSSRVTVTLDETALATGLVKVAVSISDVSLDNLVWNAEHADDVWASGGSTNWTADGTAEQFLNGDSVTFAGEGETISISGMVLPKTITVSGTGYVLGGSGSIGDVEGEEKTSLMVLAGGEMTLGTANTYEGGTTIAEGGKLTITHTQALGVGDAADAKVLGAVSGSGTLVVDTNAQTTIKGASFAAFAGTVDARPNRLNIYDYNPAQDGAFIKKLIVREGVTVETSNFANVETNTNSVDVDLMSGSTFYAVGGNTYLDGSIRFNVADPLAGTPAYNADGVVKLGTYWGQTLRYRGLVEGAGTVQIKSDWFSSSWELLNNENTFSGEYKLLVGANDYNPITTLVLGAQNAAKDATINLAGNANQTGTAKLQLNTDATIKALKSGGDGNNVVISNAAATLTVTEGDFGGSIQNGSDTNILSLTKQGATDTTLILRGANSYTGATTINGGTLELAEGATMGTTAITTTANGTFKVNAGTYANSITGAGTIAKAGTGEATLSGIAADFAGTIDVQGGTLHVGTALEIGTGRVLKAGANGAVLSSALTLAGGTYAVDYSAAGAALGLSNLALTLAGDTVLDLSGLVTDTQQETIVDLLTGVGSLLDSDGQALELTGAMASSYFNTITGLGDDIDTTTLGLQLTDGKLQLVIPEQTRYLVWGEGTGTWEAGQDFTADDEDFTADADVKFGELTGASDTVTISGAIAAGKVLIEAGEGKTYVFSAADDASGIASAERITVDSGTASFGAGTLDMTADTTLAVNDGATLSLANGAIVNAGAVDIVLNDGSTLEWETGNTTDYSANMTINGDVTLKGGGAQSSSPVALGTAIAGLTADSTTTLDGGYFSVYGAEVLTGTVKLAANTELRLKKENDTYSNAYNQNFTGEGSLRISEGATIILSGTNDYSGTTVFDNGNSKLIVQGAQALSADTSFNSTTGSLFLSKAAGAETETYNIASDYSTLKGELSIGLNQNDGGPVSGVTLNLGSTGKLGGNVAIKAGNAMDWAAGATVGGTVYVLAGAELTLHSAVANTITYGGTVKIAGDFTWDNTGKTYTGETQVLAGSTLTAAAPISSGTGSKVQLMADEEDDTVGTLVITNSANWTNKVYGAGTLVLVNTVNNLGAIVDTTSTLGTLQVGDATTSGVLVINSTGTEAASNVVQHLIVTEGSNLSLIRTTSTNTLGVNLTLSGAGDATATAGTAEAAALSIYHDQGGTKTIDSNIRLDGDTTIYVQSADAWLSGQFDSNGHTLTKTGGSRLGLNGSSIDLSGGADIQSGTLEVNHNATTALEIGAVTMATGTSLQLKGLYELADGLSVAGTTTIQVKQSATVEVSSAVTGASDAVIQLKRSAANDSATLNLTAASPFEGTWNIQASEWTVQLAHAEAAAKATLSYDASTQLKLMDGPAEAPISTYQVAALESSVARASIVTEGDTRKILAISNALTDVGAATYKGSVAGTVSVQLAGGVQKLSGALGDGSSYVVSDGTLAIGSKDQTGSHDFAAWGGVLDMTGYTRTANATGNDLITAIMAGQIHGLNLGAGMTLSDVLTTTDAVNGSSIDITATDGIVTLGGNTVLGAGQMNFRVTDSENLNEGADGAPYKLADTHYIKGTNSSDVLTLQGNQQLTHLVISVDNITTDVMDPTPEEQGGRYRDHLLISGIATTDNNNTALGALVDGKLDATGYFTMNLQNVGSTKYELLFVQNAADTTLYDLVLRASGMADTLFWNTAENGVWAAEDQTPDAWLLAERESASDPWTPGTTTADFEQYDMVIFDDLMGADGTTPLAQVELTTKGDVQIGTMTVQADTTNYIINGSISSAEGNTGATLTKTGAASLTLTGANSYAGDTTISGGTIIAQHEAALSNTTVHVDGTTLVLDYETAADGDGVFDATVQLDSYSTRDFSMLRSLRDAEVDAKFVGSRDKQLQAAADATLTINLVQDAVNGTLQVNEDEDMTGTVVMDLAANKTHAHTGTIFVFQGELVLTGESTTRWNSTSSANVEEGATLRVQGGMTLQTSYLEGANGTYGTISLEDASNLVLTAANARTIRTAIESEGATLSATGANAVLTVTDLTIKGEDGADGLNRTLLSGGTWVLNAGAVTWDSAATAALAVGANTTVKVNDDTMKNLRVANTGAVLTTAKAGSAAAELSVEKVNVSAGGAVNGVNLTITGTGSMIQGAVAGVTVNQAGTIDLTGTPALTFASGGAGTALRASLADLDILSGCVQVPALNNPVMVTSGSVNINGANALLDLSGANKLTKADGTTAADITINAGGIQGAQTYNGLITVDDKGTVLTDGMTLKNLSNSATVLLDTLTVEDTGMTTLKGMQGMTLADGSALVLTAALEEAAGHVLFDFADDATGTLKMAQGAVLNMDVNAVLGDVLDDADGSVTYTLADADATDLNGKVVFDAALKLYNITAMFTDAGHLVLTRTETPLEEDAIYRSSVDNMDDGASDQWGGNGPGVYASGDAYASVYIDKNTEIDLTQATPDAVHAEDGLVLSNLIGRGNGADLTISGNGDDKVTINNNLEADELGSNVSALSFNGDITVTGTTLQLKNTVASAGAEGAGSPDADSVYQMNGSLSTDADSRVDVVAGVLKLNGKGSKASHLLGGVMVESGMGLLDISGEAAVGGDLSIGTTYGDDALPDARLNKGGKMTLLDGAVVREGFDIYGEGKGKETLSIAKDATVVLEGNTVVAHTLLEVQEGATLQMGDGVDDTLPRIEVDGLRGSGALTSEPAGLPLPLVQITPQGQSSFSGDLSGYEGGIYVSSEGPGTQTLDKVTTAADSKLDLMSDGNLLINVAEETDNKTLNVRDLQLGNGSATTIEMNVDGAAPVLTVSGRGTVWNEAALTLSSNSNTVLSADDDLLLAVQTGMGDVAGMNGAGITLDITDNAFRKLNEEAALVVKDGRVYVNLAASDTNRYETAVNDPNAKAGAQLLWPVNPGDLPEDSDLKAVEQAVADLLKAGDKGEAERVLAAVAGSSSAVLGMAFSDDVERQLRAIRNRTTTMGVNQCEVNEGMPYVNAWINAEGDHRELDSDGLAAGYTLDSWGGTVGFDMDLTAKLTMGLAVTAMYGDLEADGPDRAEGDFDTQYVSLFARVAHRAWVHTFVATMGRADVSLNRTVSFPGGSYEAQGESEGMGYGFMYEVARTFSLSEDGSSCWQPVFNVAWRHSNIDAYTEKGGDAVLDIGEQEMNVVTFGLGARLQSVIGENLYNRTSIFEARALVKIDAGDREGEAEVALLEGDQAATVTSAEMGAVGVEIGAGVTIPVGMESGSIFLDGSAEFRSGYTHVNGTVGYRVNF